MKLIVLKISIFMCLLFALTPAVFAVVPPCLDQPLITYVAKTQAGYMPCGSPMVLCWVEYTYGIRTITYNGNVIKEIVMENVDINSDCPCIDYFQKSIFKYILNNEQSALGVSDTLAIGGCDTLRSVRVTQQGCYSAHVYMKNMHLYTRFIPCDDSECCYDEFMVVYCKTNCPYPDCRPIVSIMHGIGDHTISEPCTPPCYSWCGKYSFEDPGLVPDLQDVTTSEPYSGVFIPKLNLEIGNNNNNKDIKIIPNPVNSNCTIEIDNEYYGNAEIIIYDASGNIVLKSENKKEKGLLSIVTNLNNLVTGVYYCSVRIDGLEIGNKSFIINK